MDPAPGAVGRGRAGARAAPVLLAVAGLATIGAAEYASSLLPAADSAWLAAGLGAGTLASLGMPYAIRRSGAEWRGILPWLVGASLAIAVASVLTGIGNGGTDENRTTPAFLGELLRGHDPYTTLLGLRYEVSILDVWHRWVGSVGYDPYLPWLMFLQVPGTGYLGYDLLCIGCWVGLVYTVRNDELAAVTMATPMVALVAANGFNDLPVLFLTTLALRGGLGRGRWIVEFVTYGLKQFANVFWVGYYALQRRWGRVLGVLAGTLAIAAPFLWWHPHGFLCETLTFGAGPGCGLGGGHPVGLYLHWNYYLWIVWAVALFELPLLAGAARLWGRLPRRRNDRGPSGAR
ncbi:MAG TPA: hypothetical protein VML94_02260 [Thermoplasmata archaeon]|nr:hypothetical protein [Thermoplasmata archaeon]